MILYEADPRLVDMRVGQASQPSTSDGEFYVRHVPPPPPLPPAPSPPAPPPPDVLKELQGQTKLDEINLNDLDQRNSSPGKQVNLTLVISITAGVVSGLALCIVACCLLKPKPKPVYSSMSSLGSPDSDPTDATSIQMTPSAMLKSNKHQSYKAGSRKGKKSGGIWSLFRPKKQGASSNKAEIPAARGKAGGKAGPGAIDRGKDPKSAGSNTQQSSAFIVRPLSAPSGSTFRHTRPVSAGSTLGLPQESR